MAAIRRNSGSDCSRYFISGVQRARLFAVFIANDLQSGRRNNDFPAVIPPEGARANNVGAGGLAWFHESARRESRDLARIEEMRAQAAAARNVRIVGEGRVTRAREGCSSRSSASAGKGGGIERRVSECGHSVCPSRAESTREHSLVVLPPSPVCSPPPVFTDVPFVICVCFPL